MDVRGVSRRRVLRAGALLGGSAAAGGRAAAQSETGATEWPTFGFDRRNGAASPALGPTGEVSPAWRHGTGGPVASSPAVAAGSVVVGSEDGSLYALDAVSGDLRWTVETGGAVRSSPAVHDGTVYVGSDDGTVRAVRAGDGSVQWAAETGASVTSSPVVADGTVHVGSEDGSLYALATADGEEQWTVESGSPIVSSPAVAGGTVYVGSADANCYAVDAASGEVTWRFETGDGIASSPAVAGGTVYVGSSDGHLYALSAADGTRQWRYETGGLVGTSPAVADGTVYVSNGLFGQRLYAIDTGTGSRQWVAETGGSLQSSPAVADGLVYVGSGDGNVYAVDAGTGELRWSFETGDVVASSPAVVDGAVYVGSNDGTLYALTDDGIPARIGPDGWGLTEVAPIAFGVLGIGGGGAWLLRRRRTGGGRGSEAGDDPATDERAPGGTTASGVAAGSAPAEGGGDGPAATATESDPADSSPLDHVPTPESTPTPPSRQPTADRIPSAPSLSVDYGALADREVLGSGGSADVVRATCPTPEGEYTIAVKEPRVTGTVHADDAARLLSEAEVWDGIDDHDHIVSVLDYGADPLPWIAMEYMDGGTLAERAGELDLPQALWTALAVTGGVRHAHREGVAHLDLKPQNVLFREVDGVWDVPKVGDWGLSRYLLDHSNSVEGLTPTYAAPEQFHDDRPTDDITDVYQLGTVFYELFTGRPPFEGRPAAVMQAVMETEPAPPSEVADLPPELDEILLTALAKERADRYDDVVYLRDGLREVYEAQW